MFSVSVLSAWVCWGPQPELGVLWTESWLSRVSSLTDGREAGLGLDADKQLIVATPPFLTMRVSCNSLAN